MPFPFTAAPCDATPAPCQIGYDCKNTDDATKGYVKCDCKFMFTFHSDRIQVTHFVVHKFCDR